MVNEPKNKRNNISAIYSTLTTHTVVSSYSPVSELIINSSKLVGKSRRKAKITKKESFFLEFASEFDIFPLQKQFPEWIYFYRDEILARIVKPFRVLCQFLKDAGIRFYMKYPVEIDGMWKFADVYIPDKGLVILLLSEKEAIGSPCHSEDEQGTLVFSQVQDYWCFLLRGE